jgi:hypothetical protein
MAFEYTIIDGVDKIIEERGNEFTALRKIRWGDGEKDYLELRRWRNAPDGKEQCAKGCTFMTEEGPSELVNALVDLGYGDTREVLTHLSTREDFRKAVNSVLGKNDELYDESEGTLEDSYYDPKSFVNGGM